MKLPQHPIRPQRVFTRIVAISWRDLFVSLAPSVLLLICGIWLMITLVRPAPPDHLTITTGPVGTPNWLAAQRFAQILGKNGVKLTVLASQGSPDNLSRLLDRKQKVDVGFVQGGLDDAPEDAHLISLGSMGYVPLAILYRGPVIQRLSELAHKRLALGAAGSGTRKLGLALLALNGIEPGGDTQLLTLDHQEAADALVDNKVDAVFMSGDSTQIPTLAKLVKTPGVHLYSFDQAQAYVRRLPYLSVITIPAGLFDLARDIPATDVSALSPTVELIARDTLHPALSDLLLSAAREVEGPADALHGAGEFPAPVTHGSFPLSDDAARYYKSGKRFLYQELPFWLASLFDRVLFLLVPLVVVLIPALRILPLLYGWRVRSRIYRWYGVLIALERDAVGNHTSEERTALLHRLDTIEAAVNRLNVPLAYAGQFYVLREHIGYVRAYVLAHYPDSLSAPSPLE